LNDPPAAALERIQRGDRRQLARALSQAESSLPQARHWLDELWAAAGDVFRPSFRLAITGPPGAGKSTLIEALGSRLLEHGERVAVLPVDPSSRHTGGSLLGDAVRMPRLSADSRAFVRPMPTGNMLGGLASASLECVELCELAGYDWVVVETVGVGQSEADAALLADALMLVQSPGAGDELQGLKRGINEDCDALVVNKADGAIAELARRLAADFSNATTLVRGRELPIFLTSAQEGSGVTNWVEWLQHRADETTRDAQRLRAKRAEQRAAYFERVVRQALIERVMLETGPRQHFQRLRAAVGTGQQRSPGAVNELLELLFPSAP
jgi:LAO/AO transport system kinase